MKPPVYVDPTPASETTEPTVVGLDDFIAARQDPVVHEMLAFADEYGQRLEREGRNR